MGERARSEEKEGRELSRLILVLSLIGQMRKVGRGRQASEVRPKCPLVGKPPMKELVALPYILVPSLP